MQCSATTAQRERLEKLSRYIAGMNHNSEPAEDLAKTTLQELRRAIAGSADLPVPTELNMAATWGTSKQQNDAGECRPVGCMAGIALTLFAEAVEDEYRKRANHGEDAYEIIGRVLGMGPATAGALFFGLGSGRENALETITPQEACAAIGRVLAGRTDYIWRRDTEGQNRPTEPPASARTHRNRHARSR